MKKLLLVLGVIALASCEKSNDEIITPPDSQSPRLLTVEISENPMHDENASAREMTRTAAATTTETLRTFTMNYGELWHPNFDKDNGPWSTATWPNTVDNNTPIDFYAHDGGTFIWVNDNPYVNFTMDNDAFKQKDFLVATHKQISYSESSGVVSLAFDHACAAVQFNIYKEDGNNYTVKSIKLKGIKNSADYNYKTGWGTPGYSSDWDSDENIRYYTLTKSDIDVTTNKILLPCEWLFIIPQSKSGITIDVTYTKNGGNQTTKTLNLSSGTWQAGYKYTVNIRIGKSASS